MIQFFIKHKKTRGVITVFLTIIYLTAYMFAGVFVDGARVKMAQTIVEDVQQISNENIMAQYDRGLYEYYGLMATCGYDPDVIAKEVQEEINAAIGLKFDVDEVKAFITNCFINATNGYGIASWSDANTKEVKNANNFFKPYQLDVKIASISTIDLTDIDVLRAQIRDEMRYKFPVILGASFFDELEQFLTLGQAAKEIKAIVDKITEGTESVVYKQSVYYESINKFYDEYHNFLSELYGNNGEVDKSFTDDLIEGLNTTVDVIKKGLANAFGGLIDVAQFITGFDGKSVIRNYENVKYRKGIYDRIEKITNNSDDDFIINKISDAYNAQPWPQANNYYIITNEEDSDEEDYEPEYELDEVAFKEAINNMAPKRNDDFKTEIDKFKQKIKSLKEYDREPIEYVKNIDIPCLSEFIGFGVNLVTDTLKGAFNIGEEISSASDNSKFKNAVIALAKLPKAAGDLIGSYEKTIKEFANRFDVIGIINREDTIGIEKSFPKVSLKFGGIDDLIKAHEEYTKEVEAKLKFFADEYEKYYNDDDNQKIQDIYASYLEMFLISWAELKADGVIFEKIKKCIEEIDKEFDNSSVTAEDFTNSIIYSSLDSIYSYEFTKGEDGGSKSEPDHLEEFLRDRQTEIVERIKEHVGNINEDALKYLENLNNVDTLQSSLVRLCSAVFSIMSDNKMSLFDGEHKEMSMSDWQKIYPNATKDELNELINGGKDIYIDPWEHIVPYDKPINPTESQSGLQEDSFNIFKIASTVRKILSVPIDIVERVPKEFTNDMNDVSYILSHFRDYVHTYRAGEVEVIDKNGNKKEGYDNILNARFIKDQSETEYLNNAQYDDIKVTPAEIEYILFGNEGENSNVKNVVSMYTTIFLIRTAINYVSVFFSANALKSVNSISSSLGPFAPIGIVLAPLIYALPQSAIETKNMMDCEKEDIVNTGFGLYDPYKDELFKEIQSSVSGIQSRAKEVLRKTKTKVIEGLGEYIGKEIISSFDHDSILKGQANEISGFEMPTVLIILNNIDAIDESDKGPVPENVKKAKEQLSKWLSKKIYEVGVEFLKDEEESEGGVTEKNEDTKDDKGIKAGYSTYLTLLLFLFGCTTDGKTEQMTRVQNVIETNMKKAYKRNGAKDDKLFKLKNAYARVAVETECSINYIFMTNAFMPTSVKFADNDRFNFKIRTASAY